ncbi:MAG: endonuclease [Flavobacteriaceae bacterium]|nr:endonuclease [Flavobacteriaceae bacterium]
MLNTFSIAFYNLENLFDTKRNKYILDKSYTAGGDLEWNQDRYARKIQNLSNVISKIGIKNSKLPPIFIGVSEVENKACLSDLINSEKLLPFKYDFVHYNSPDERGIDVAFLYQKKYFDLIYSNTYTLYLTDGKNNRDYTRDILLVSGKLFNEQIYIIINHWPSRSKGIGFSDHKRVKAANLVREIIIDIHKENKNPKIIIMGDFNDQPSNNSIKNHLMTDAFFNPMFVLQQQNRGSVNYRGKWYLFDQIILSKLFLNNVPNKIKFKDIDIFDAHFIQEKTGKRKGSPKRTYIGKWHQGGFSDHFPVLAYFQKIIKL